MMNPKLKKKNKNINMRVFKSTKWLFIYISHLVIPETSYQSQIIRGARLTEFNYSTP
jgi:hypothetical protein